MSELLRWRREFPILENSVYLVSHSMGAMPRKALDRLKEYTDLWNIQGIAAWDTWFSLPEETGNLVCRFFDGDPGTVIFHQNVSSLFSIILSCYDFSSPRRKIVISDVTFPTLAYNAATRRREGAEVVTVQSPDGCTLSPERFVEAIDERTALVVLDHGLFRSGALIEVEAIARAARSRGAHVLVDAYQTIGVVPISVKKWGVEYLVGGSHKWLCGGPGAAFLYVRKDMISNLEPRITGWFSHERPFGFETQTLQYAQGPRRFLGGTPGIGALYAARAGYEILLEVGVDRIRGRNLELSERILEHASIRGFPIRTPRAPEKRGGVVCMDFDGAQAVEQELVRRRFFVDYRPQCGIRMSPHFYTKEEEIDAAFEEIDKIRRKV